MYGTLLTGEGNAHWARGARRTPAWATGTIHDTGYGYPAFVRNGETRIQGELLTVDDEGFKSMDRLEGFPRLYRREEIDVFTSLGRARAWVYIMNRLPEGAKVIAGGDWRKYRRESGKRRHCQSRSVGRADFGFTIDRLAAIGEKMDILLG